MRKLSPHQAHNMLKGRMRMGFLPGVVEKKTEPGHERKGGDGTAGEDERRTRSQEVRSKSGDQERRTKKDT